MKSVSSKNTCILVPVINEGCRFLKQLEELKMIASAKRLHILIVDSGDASESSQSRYSHYPNVKTIIGSEQKGLGLALRCGLMYARDRGYSGVITMDGNGKDGVDAIPRFIERLEEGYDLVQGSRFMPGGHHEHTPRDRLFGIKRIVAPAVRHAGGYPFTDPTNGFRALSMRLIEHAGMDLFRPCFVRFNFQLYLLCRAPRQGLMLTEWTIRGSWDL